jgi:hypothetical protein
MLDYQAFGARQTCCIEGSVTFYTGACIASLERIPAEVERLASDLIELSWRYNFAFWLPGANMLRG